MGVAFYNINDVVKFSLEGPLKFVNSGRYENYREDSIPYEELDFIVNVQDFHPKIDNCRIYDDTVYIKENYIFCSEENYKIIKWKIELENFEQKPIILNISFNQFYQRISKIPYIIIEGTIIDAIIHYVLLKKGFSLIHGATIINDTSAFLFVGRGGSGKTTITTKIINKNNFDIISDNFSILAVNKEIFGFVEPMNLFSYNITEKINNSLNNTQKIELLLKRIVYVLSFKYAKLFIRFTPDWLKANINHKFQLKKAFLLLPKLEAKEILVTKISKELLSEHICYNNMLEFPYLDKYLLYYSYAFPDGETASHWKIYKHNLFENLCENAYIISYPKKLDDKILNDIINNVLLEIKNA